MPDGKSGIHWRGIRRILDYTEQYPINDDDYLKKALELQILTTTMDVGMKFSSLAMQNYFLALDEEKIEKMLRTRSDEA